MGNLPFASKRVSKFVYSLRFAARRPSAERKDFLLFLFPPLKRRATTNRPAAAGLDYGAYKM
jgi:hypothetical protein